MKNSYLLFGLIAMLVVSCSKEQRIVNKMEGKWNVISVDLLGFGEVEPNLIFEFDYCRKSKSDFCEFPIHDFTADEVFGGSYSVNEQGDAIILSSSIGFGMDFNSYSIEKLNNRRLILRHLNAEIGECREIELKFVK